MFWAGKKTRKNVVSDFQIVWILLLVINFINHIIGIQWIPGYSLVTNFCPGQIFVWFLSIFFRFLNFKIKITISRKNWHFIFSFFSHVESGREFPPFSRNFRPFPGNFRPEKLTYFAQSRVRSAQKVRNTKLTTLVKKRPFPGPSQEIRPKGRNLANG